MFDVGLISYVIVTTYFKSKAFFFMAMLENQMTVWVLYTCWTYIVLTEYSLQQVGMVEEQAIVKWYTCDNCEEEPANYNLLNYCFQSKIYDCPMELMVPWKIPSGEFS